MLKPRCWTWKDELVECLPQVGDLNECFDFSHALLEIDVESNREFLHNQISENRALNNDEQAEAF